MIRTRTILSKRVRGECGFTIVELLTTIVLMGILAGAMLGIFVSLNRSFADTAGRIQSQDEARKSIDRLSRYLRMASPSEKNESSVSDAIALASNQEMVFYADIDGDGITERVRFYLVGETLRMSTVAPDMSANPPSYPASYTQDSIIAMDGVKNGSTPIFTYYEMDPARKTNPTPTNDRLVPMTRHSTAAELSDILAIGLTIYINESPHLSKSPVRLETLVQLRQRNSGGERGN